MNPSTKKYLARIGAKGGSVRSEAKAAAARENGRKGGWKKTKKENDK